MSEKVRVMRNPSRESSKPWFVICDLCAGGDDFLSILAPSGRKGWAPTWRVAQDYAARHALDHEKTRCSTCLHVPTEPLPSERKASA